MTGSDTTGALLQALPQSRLTLNDARSKLSGWHFAKESLSDNEREILYVAEALLRLLDHEADGYRHV